MKYSIEDCLCLTLSALIILILRFAWKSTFVASSPETLIKKEFDPQKVDLTKRITIYIQYFDEFKEKVDILLGQTISEFIGLHFPHKYYPVKLIYRGHVLKPSVQFCDIDSLQSESVVQCHIASSKYSHYSTVSLMDEYDDSDQYESCNDTDVKSINPKIENYFQITNNNKAMTTRIKNLTINQHQLWLAQLGYNILRQYQIYFKRIYNFVKANFWIYLGFAIILTAWLSYFLFFRLYFSTIITLSLISVTVTSLFLFIITIIEPLN